MFVDSLFAEKWEDRADHGVETINPTWDQVKQAILNLDGRTRTTVLLTNQAINDHYLGISGQWDGSFMVNTTPDNHDFFSLVDSSRSTRKVTVFVGGQDVELEEQKCVPLEWALEAAEHFFHTGERKPTMNRVSDF